jgi:hypothetical protein
MDIFRSIDQHLRVLRGVLGEIPATDLAPHTTQLEDGDVVTVIAEASAAIAALEAVRVVASGVAAARSTREAGHSGLAQVRGHRSPVSLVQELSGSTRADAAKQVRLGESLLDGRSDRGAGPESGDAEPVDTEPVDVEPVDTEPVDTEAGPQPERVEPWHAPLGRALLAGVITTTQHDAILRGLGEPPIDDAGAAGAAVVEAWRLAAEQLIPEAAVRTVEELGRSARTIRDLLDSEGAQRRFDERFHARSFRVWTDRDGIRCASFRFDDEGGAWVAAIIDAALRPRRGGPRFVDPDEKERADDLVADPRTNEQLAYDLIIDTLRAGALADAKTVFGAKQPGIRVVRVVSPDRDDRTAPGYIEETSDPVPAWLIDQRACDTGTVDCALDTAGNPLYLGRDARLFTPAQKVALALRDGGCRAPGCDRPAHYCESHHIDPYSEGGRTDIDRGILLCAFHHRALHHGGWQITRERDGDFVLHRPGSGPTTMRPRLALTYAWAGIDPPPRRFRPAA